MSVFINSKQALVNYLNASNGTSMFTLANLIFSDPAPVAGTWREEITQRNTYMKLNAAPSAGFKGRTVITYDRLRLEDFAKFKPNRILPAYQPAKVHDLIPNILYYYGIFLTVDDIINDDVILDGNGAGIVTVRAKPTSPIWLGELTFDVRFGGANIAEVMAVKDLNGLNYPVSDPTTQVSALLYCYPFDASEWRDQLLLIPDNAVLSQANADLLVNIFKTVDLGAGKDLWNATAGNTQWSLQGATVFFNGLNSMAYPTNQAYKYVIGLELRGDVTVPSGRFYLHYNDPDDPNSAE